ncbi:helix-turn-helix transcriptional regulator [Anaerococcus sp. Marseille-Q5996]|uniref:helix-turn-helix transcriptional regulator n=1 Tax=Anaerococcus sp. Marseille-Q5996 TaxID=2972769 RepID=UPI0021C90DD4|nr:helix-turn-helix transcriptional regulator [Anaerococcus sp. Marseille-Q5996]
MNSLKKFRKAANMKQKELAEKVGVNCRTISSYETGARDMPVKVAKKIGKVLNIDWWILYED